PPPSQSSVLSLHDALPISGGRAGLGGWSTDREALGPLVGYELSHLQNSVRSGEIRMTVAVSRSSPIARYCAYLDRRRSTAPARSDPSVSTSARPWTITQQSRDHSSS